MVLHKKWCDATKEKDERRRYWTYAEKDGGRDEIRDALAKTMRSQYNRLDRIAFPQSSGTTHRRFQSAVLRLPISRHDHPA